LERNPVTISPAASLGGVSLAVADLNAQVAFYKDAIGLREIRRDTDTVELGAPGTDATLVSLVRLPDAPRRPPRTTGLFHLALLVPSRTELARALHRVTGAGHRFTGASDHLVSEALYLDDPEGNGIEIYRDRPREEWTYEGGQLAMATLPLDLENVLAGVSPGDAGNGMAPETRIGHVHLQVADIPAAEAFYVDVLGFEPTVRGYPGALFVSAGGYHHHIGLNTWAGVGAPAPPAGSRGLRSFTIILSDTAELRRIVAAAGEAGVEVTADGEGRDVIADPSGNAAVLVAA
jgi:catechol 2,3-dioxygenase